MMHNNTLELFGPLAAKIREVLFHEWDPHSSNHHPASADIYDDYIPAIHRLVRERHSTADDDIEHIAAYLNFVVKNYVGKPPDKGLNLTVAAKIFALAEAARQCQLSPGGHAGTTGAGDVDHQGGRVPANARHHGLEDRSEQEAGIAV